MKNGRLLYKPICSILVHSNIIAIYYKFSELCLTFRVLTILQHIFEQLYEQYV